MVNHQKLANALEYINLHFDAIHPPSPTASPGTAELDEFILEQALAFSARMEVMRPDSPRPQGKHERQVRCTIARLCY